MRNLFSRKRMVSVNEVRRANFSLPAVRFVNPIIDVSLPVFCKKSVALDAKKYFISVLFVFFPWCLVMRAHTVRTIFGSKQPYFGGNICSHSARQQWRLATCSWTHHPHTRYVLPRHFSTKRIIYCVLIFFIWYSYNLKPWALCTQSTQNKIKRLSIFL